MIQKMTKVKVSIGHSFILKIRDHYISLLWFDAKSKLNELQIFNIAFINKYWNMKKHFCALIKKQNYIGRPK